MAHKHVHAQPPNFLLMSCNIETEIWAEIVKYIYLLATTVQYYKYWNFYPVNNNAVIETSR